MADATLQCRCDKSKAVTSNPEKLAELEAYLAELPLDGADRERRQGFLIHCLHRAQAIFGYLPMEVQELVADRLRLQMSDVYGVISFYSFFTNKPVGRNKISVCMGTACYVGGADKILEAFKEKLGIEEGGTTPDMRISLVSLRCVGACSLAPVVMVNDKVYGGVTVRQVPQIIADCQ